MQNIRILVVEDELNYQITFEMYLEEMGYDLIEIVDNATDALRLIKATKPDLLLLDIKIKGEMNGIQLAEKIHKTNPVPIIFITAFQDRNTFAKAKEIKPYAYLIKPFSEITLQNAIELAIQNYAEKTKEKQFPIWESDDATTINNSFFVKERNKLVKLQEDDILWIEVVNKYCDIHTKDRKYVIRISLKDLYENISQEKFIQTHRNFIVNFNHIESVNTRENTIKIHDTNIPVSRFFKAALTGKMSFLE